MDCNLPFPVQLQVVPVGLIEYSVHLPLHGLVSAYQIKIVLSSHLQGYLHLSHPHRGKR